MQYSEQQTNKVRKKKERIESYKIDIIDYNAVMSELIDIILIFVSSTIKIKNKAIHYQCNRYRST